MNQKIIKIGNSTGIIIPKSILDAVGLKIGGEVRLETDKISKALIIQNKASAQKNSSINPYFLKILNKVNKQYASALQSLAQK